MGPKAETYTLNQVKELLQMHEIRLTTLLDRLDKKTDILKEENSRIKKKLTDLKESVHYHSNNVGETNKKLEEFDRTVEELKLDKITEDLSQK